MFTLPASVSQHITAKLVVAVLLDVLSVAAAILAVLALALDGHHVARPARYFF